MVGMQVIQEQVPAKLGKRKQILGVFWTSMAKYQNGVKMLLLQIMNLMKAFSHRCREIPCVVFIVVARGSPNLIQLAVRQEALL